MDATRAEVERELQRMRRCIGGLRLKIKEQQGDIRMIASGSCDSPAVQVRLDWLKQSEQELLQYRYVERILQDILDKTKDTPSSGEVGK